MIAPLRRWHSRAWIVLALAIPAIIALGLSARRPTTPPNPSLHWSKLP